MSTDNEPNQTPPAPSILIDAHVHLYDCFDRVTFFDTARANFQRSARDLGLPDDTPGCLMLTETAHDHAFEALIAQHELDNGRWRFHPASEGRSLIAALDGQDVMTVIAGRQIVTHEGLEVLALCCNEQFNDDRPIEHTIEKVIEADGLPVLPYGVGKWSGARGVIISKLIDSPLGSRLCLGDNAGRLALGGEPGHFEKGREHGIWVLPGTDPLPFASQESRVGSYGLILDTAINRDKPATSLLTHLQSLDAQPRTYGKTDGLVSFLAKQVRMQARKRFGSR